MVREELCVETGTLSRFRCPQYRNRMKILGGGVAAGLLAMAACVGDAPVGSESPTTDAGTDAGSTVVITGGGEGTIKVTSNEIFVVRGKDAVVTLGIDATSVQQSMIVKLVAPPAGFQSADVSVAAGATTATLVLSTSDAAAYGAQSLTISVTSLDGKAAGQTTLHVTVRGGPGTLDSSFGVQGVLKIPYVPGEGSPHFFVPVGGSSLYSLADKSLATFMAKYVDSGQVDPTFAPQSWTPSTDSTWRILFGLPTLTTDNDGSLTLLTGYWNEDQAQVHLRRLSANGASSGSPLEFGLEEGLGYINGDGYLDRAHRLSDGRFMTITRGNPSTAKMWKADGTVDSTWGTSGSKSGPTFDDQGFGATAGYVLLSGTSGNTGAIQVIPKGAGPWVTCSGHTGIGALAVGSDEVVHVVAGGPGTATVSTVDPTKVAGSDCLYAFGSLTHPFAYPSGAPALYAALDGGTMLIHLSANGLMLEHLDGFNQLRSSFGTAGTATLPTTAELTTGFATADGKFYVDTQTAVGHELYRLWL